jgi:hypothetical protein
MPTNPDPALWWKVWSNGINAQIAMAGIGLMKAASVLDNPALKTVAQRQLDWIIGANPFSSSTLIGVGHNHPPHYMGCTGAFRPGTPVLPGAVMNGLTGDYEDRPRFILQDNAIQSEYWTPPVACTLWLMAEINNKQ